MKKLILIGEISQYAENISTKFPAMTTTTTTNTTKILTNKDLTATNTTNLTTATSTPSTDTSRSKVDEDEQIHTDDRVLDQEEIINDGDNVDGRGINSVDSFEYSEVANSVDVNKKKEILFEQQESNESINKSEMTSLLGAFFSFFFFLRGVGGHVVDFFLFFISHFLFVPSHKKQLFSCVSK